MLLVINQNFPRWPKSTRSNLMQRKITISISAAILIPNYPIWKPTRKFTAEKNRLFVHSATTLAIKLAGLESTIHMRFHSGEKPYSCKQCEYSSTRAHILKRDMLTHSGEKPFHCTHCTSSFTQRGNFKEHMLAHQGRGVSVVTSATIHASKPWEVTSSTSSISSMKSDKANNFWQERFWQLVKCG